MKFDNQLRYASGIIAAYKGDPPLHTWLKNFFREHKQMGSRDRKLVSQLVYGFYRLGHAVKNIPVEERILAGLFLCNDSPHDLLQYFKPHWNENAARPLEQKIAVCRHSGIGFQPTDIFPWKEELSEGIDHTSFCLSFLRQPDLFLRIRPGHEEEVLRRLAQQPAAYEFIPPFTLRLPNGFKVEELFTPDKEIVIQDYSSQRMAPFLQLQNTYSPHSQPGDLSKDRPAITPAPTLSVWDACAASGGKSLLAWDLNLSIDLTVSDIRESILHNLRHRFRQAGIKNYQAFIADLTAPGPIGGEPVAGSSTYHSLLTTHPFDLIIADVPCSGSGTWSRTPEELYFFDPGKISCYNEWQKKIVLNAVPYLSKGAYLVYSTCSVFKKENEEMVGLIRQSSRLQPDRMDWIKGYDEKADSMFAVRFIS